MCEEASPMYRAVKHGAFYQPPEAPPQMVFYYLGSKISCKSIEKPSPFIFYKFYTQIAKTTDRPYTAMLFINYLSTAEGIATYQEGKGVYSTNSTVQQDIDSLLDGFVLENYADIKSDWASIVKLLEGYN